MPFITNTIRSALIRQFLSYQLIFFIFIFKLNDCGSKSKHMCPYVNNKKQSEIVSNKQENNMKLNALTVKIIYLFLLTIIVAQTSCSKPKTRKTPYITPKNKAASNINDNFEVIETIKNPKALISSKNFPKESHT